MSHMTKLFLVDDHSLLRTALRDFLSRRDNLEIVGEAATGEAALSEITRVQPDVVLMDITLPDSDGIEITEAIVAALPQIKIIAVTMHPEEQCLLRFLKAGGRGYVNKAAADRELLEAIASVQEGNIFVSQVGVKILAGQHVERSDLLKTVQKEELAHEILSPRELQIMSMLSRGYTSRKVGAKMFLAPSTVETYKRRIMDKMKFSDKTEMVEYAIRHNIVSGLKGDG